MLHLRDRIATIMMIMGVVFFVLGVVLFNSILMITGAIAIALSIFMPFPKE